MEKAPDSVLGLKLQNPCGTPEDSPIAPPVSARSLGLSVEDHIRGSAPCDRMPRPTVTA